MSYQRRIYVYISAKISWVILVVFFTSSCSSDDKVMPYNFEFPSNLIVLGHKGSGTFEEYGNTFRDNSVSGILNALEQLDGAEFDLQMSLDSTLWLFHDHVILNCNQELENFALLSDSLIEVNSSCNYDGKISSLEDLVNALKKTNTPSKTISLDLKVLQNPFAIERFGGEEELAKFLAERIKSYFIEFTELQLFIEVPFENQVKIVEEITGKTTFLIQNSFEYLQDETKFNHSAPIHHYAIDVPQSFQNYGQHSQLWVVNSAEEMMNALKLEPTAIQTDNIPMVQFFKQLPYRGEVVTTTIYPASDTLNDFFLLSKVDAQIEQNQLYEFNFGRNKLEGVQLVFSSADKLRASTKWKSMPLYNTTHYFFLGKKEHEMLGTKEYSIYLWHTDGSAIQLLDQVEVRKIELSHD